MRVELRLRDLAFARHDKERQLSTPLGVDKARECQVFVRARGSLVAATDTRRVTGTRRSIELALVLHAHAQTHAISTKALFGPRLLKAISNMNDFSQYLA